MHVEEKKKKLLEEERKRIKTNTKKVVYKEVFLFSVLLKKGI
jgi:hypothetical protein